jgi:hypothetical protein
MGTKHRSQVTSSCFHHTIIWVIVSLTFHVIPTNYLHVSQKTLLPIFFLQLFVDHVLGLCHADSKLCIEKDQVRTPPDNFDLIWQIYRFTPYRKVSFVIKSL